jgi:hypothetical protein
MNGNVASRDRFTDPVQFRQNDSSARSGRSTARRRAGRRRAPQRRAPMARRPGRVAIPTDLVLALLA